MDPTAQNNNSLDSNTQPTEGQKPNFIEPGQFVVAGAEVNNAKASPITVPAPSPQTSAPSTSVSVKQVPDLQQAVSQALQEENPQGQKKSEPTHVPIVHLAQEESTASQPIQPPIQPDAQMPNPQNTQPDPSIFTPPNAMGANTQTPHELIHGNGKSSILKNVFIGVGALVLIGILGVVAYFFIVQKGNLPISAKSAINAVTQLEEPPSIPKRTTGGFANLPPVSKSATQSATPSGSLFPQF